MINHVRTLLLNRTARAGGLASDTPGAEYVPADYTPIRVPPALDDVRRAFLPDGLSSYQINFRLLGLMKLLHMPELEKYTLLLDPRYTYVFADNHMAALRDAAVTVDRWAYGDCDVTMSYNHFNARRWTHGVDTMKWCVTHFSTYGNSVDIACDGKKLQRLPIEMKGTASTYIPLVPDYLYVRFEAVSGMLSGQFRFDVTYQPAMPLDIIGTLAELTSLDNRTDLLGTVFVPWPAQQDTLDALHDLWRYSPEAGVRFGAMLLAYAFRCERIRVGQEPVTGPSTLVRY